MKWLLLCITALGVAASLTACGATIKNNVKDESVGGGDWGRSQHETALAHHPDWWVYDTPFGY